MERAPNKIDAFLAGWVDFVRRRAVLVLAIAVALTVAAGWHAVSTLRIDTSTTDMLSPDLSFRQNAKQIDRAFPQLDDLILIVVDGATADQAEDGAAALAAALRERTDIVRSVFYPQGDPFFRNNGLLYLSPDDLGALVDRLAGAQAFLGKLWRDPSLRGLFDVLTLALENSGENAPPAGLARVLNAVAGTVEAHNAGRPAVLSWREILEGEQLEPGDRRRLVVVQPAVDYASLAPAGKSIEGIREAAKGLGLTEENGFRIRLTGSAPLAEEELVSVMDGMEFAAVLSLLLMGGLLFWGLRSVRLTLVTMVTLTMGLIWTADIAALAVGRLNLLSVAFAVLFIGLSDEFTIHMALHVREEVDAGRPVGRALRTAAEEGGAALVLCALCAAIAFYSFLPTDYIGLAELGLIAGSGMFVALFANLTVQPALIALWPPRRHAHALSESEKSGTFSAGAIPRAIVRHAKPVVVLSALVAVAAAVMSFGARFDFDPLNLKDPRTESVRTLYDLMDDGRAGPYTIDILAGSLEQADALAKRLEALPEVEQATTLSDYVPSDQDSKLIAIDQAALFLLPAFQGDPVAPPSAAERRKAVDAFRQVLATHGDAPGVEGQAIRRLAAALGKLDASDQSLAALARSLTAALPGRLAQLRDSLEARPVTVADLPESMRGRMVAADGRARIEVEPRDDLRDRAALERFVAAVRTIAPQATGAPVTIIEAGSTVIRAFATAGAISILAIAVVIAVLLRRLREVALVFAPLVLAALLTVATTVAMGMAFNFANVIVLPLLFGLGVSSAIHLVMRARRRPDLESLFATNTPRGVVFSVASTIGSFGTMGMVGHPGTASMGILLTIAISYTLLTTLIVLPALMAVFGGKARRDGQL